MRHNNITLFTSSVENILNFWRINLMTIKLDKEWVALIKDALEVGISIEEIKDFLRENKVSEEY
jgi:Anti-repressor SinI